MTVEEMSNEFDVQYDVSSNSAPKLDDYEKSVFLTRGMYKLLNFAISDSIKEGDSLTREIIIKLITSHETLDTLGESDTRKKLVSNAVFFARANDIHKVLFEQAKLQSSDPYLNGHTSQVIPVAYDRLHRILRNPFLGAQKDRVLRTDNGLEGSADIVQLIPPANATIQRYITQYVRKPYPIILKDLSTIEAGLSIYGETLPYSGSTEATDVSEIVHNNIVKEAVILAVLAFQENSLSNNINTQ